MKKRLVPNVIKLFSVGNLDVRISPKSQNCSQQLWKALTKNLMRLMQCIWVCYLFKLLFHGIRPVLDLVKGTWNFGGNSDIKISDGKKLYNIGHWSWKKIVGIYFEVSDRWKNRHLYNLPCSSSWMAVGFELGLLGLKEAVRAAVSCRPVNCLRSVLITMSRCLA